MMDVLILDPSLIEIPNDPGAKAALVDFCVLFQDRWGKHPVYSMVEIQDGERLRIRTQYDSGRNMADYITEYIEC